MLTTKQETGQAARSSRNENAEVFPGSDRGGGALLGMTTVLYIESGQVWTEGQTVKAEMVRSCETSGILPCG